LKTCDAAPRGRLLVRWASLLHDTGKVDARQIVRDQSGERVVFYGHEVLSAEMAESILSRLRYPRDFTAACRHLVAEHMYRYEASWKASTVRRFMRRIGDAHVDDLLALREADCRSRHLDDELTSLADLRSRIDDERRGRAVLQVTDLAIDGRDVMREAKLPSGPAVRRVLERLLDRVTETPELNTRERLLELVRATEDENNAGESKRGEKSRKPA